MRDRNSGFSLVELIVVIAIMAILVGVATYSFALVTGKEAGQCANNLGTALDKAKNYALAKSGSTDAYLLVKYDSDEGYIAEYYVPDSPIATAGNCHLVESEKLGKKSVEVTVELDGVGFISLDDSKELRVYFNRITGAFKEAELVSGGSVIHTAYCNKIEVKRGKQYELDLIAATGKHTITRVN